MPIPSLNRWYLIWLYECFEMITNLCFPEPYWKLHLGDHSASYVWLRAILRPIHCASTTREGGSAMLWHRRAPSFTINFPWTKGWQLSKEREPAVVARTWALRSRVSDCCIRYGIMWISHNTRGDLIFSARRVRLTLFQACKCKINTNVASRGGLTLNWSHRREYAGLAPKLLVMYRIVPAFMFDDSVRNDTHNERKMWRTDTKTIAIHRSPTI